MLFKKQIHSPIGKLTLVASNEGIREIVFPNSSVKNENALRKEKHPLLLQCEKELKEYFEGKRSEFSVPLEIEGTEFQKKAWKALTKIPYGKTKSYAEQAVRAGNYKAIRAIGAANGKNPIPIIIPCHRVIASTGHLHGFGGGLDRKQKLLEIEGNRIENQKIIS